jgi:hypothetical protein
VFLKEKVTLLIPYKKEKIKALISLTQSHAIDRVPASCLKGKTTEQLHLTKKKK